MFKSIKNYFAKRTLKAMLNDSRYKFRSTQRLASAIGRTIDETKLLLVAIGARQSRRSDGLYGLVSRVGSGRRGNRSVQSA